VVDPRRAWLELQRDLGGDEVYFDAPIEKPQLAAQEPAVAASRQRPAPAPTTPPEAAQPVPAADVPPIRVRSYPAGQEPEWLKGAPPIPGYGLVVTSPEPPRWESLEEIAQLARQCTRCPLCSGRTNAVPGEGNPGADFMVVGEGPGEQEDLSGRPFVGRAGELLDKMLAAIDIERSSAFIANVVKCRPPRNRAPLPDERAACLPYLYRQIALVRPRVILALGATAAEALLGVKRPLGDLRLKVHRFDGIPLVVTYHPAALLRNPNWKRPAWDDVRIARQLLDRID